MFSNKITQQNSPIFSCESCDFNACNKKDYTRHLHTKKIPSTFLNGKLPKKQYAKDI